MAFLSSLTDAFTGAPAKKAAGQQRAFLDQTRTQGNQDIDLGYNTATGAIQAGTGAARGALGTGFQDASRLADLGATGALGYINQGETGALGRLDQAGAAFNPLQQLGVKYGGATKQYLDMLGVNGADAATAAQGAFTQNPAYSFNLEQGLDAINRRRAAGGMLASGNADRDAQEFGSGLASREINSYMDRLGSFVNPELAATSGAASGLAGINTAGANLLSQGGVSRAGIESGRGAMLADLASRYGTNLAGLETGQGNTLANLATGAAGQKVGLATNLANPYAKTYGDQATAEMQGSANLWGLGLNLAKLGVGAVGGGGLK